MSSSKNGSGNEKNEQAEVEIEPTPKQKEIIQYLANGLSQRQVSEVLGISRDTTKMQLKLLRRRLGTHTLEQCIALAARRGWIRVDDYPRPARAAAGRLRN